MAHCSLEVTGTRVVVQGFGAVGVAAAARLAELGATIVAVSTAAGGIHNPDGLDVAAMTAARASVGDAFVTQSGNGGKPGSSSPARNSSSTPMSSFRPRCRTSSTPTSPAG